MLELYRATTLSVSGIRRVMVKEGYAFRSLQAMRRQLQQVLVPRRQRAVRPEFQWLERPNARR